MVFLGGKLKLAKIFESPKSHIGTWYKIPE